MNKKLYLIRCLTNLHVGSGEPNYSIVDKEVEKDPVTDYPVIHASGIKGALRQDYKGENETLIFGAAGDNNSDSNSGSVKFFDAVFLCRPLRAQGPKASVPVTTADAVNRVIDLTEAFGIRTGLVRFDSVPAFGDNEFLCTAGGVNVEGEKTGLLDESDPAVKALKALLGEDFALARSFDHYRLPVIARNNLTTAKGNLWYEEFVPYDSRFLEILLVPDHVDYALPGIAQIGGNSSVGYGFCSFTELA